jgi:hypothetical protein
MKDRGYSTVDSRKMTKIFTLLANACYRASDSTMAIDRATQFLDEIKTKGIYVFIIINYYQSLLEIGKVVPVPGPKFFLDRDRD